MTSNARLEELKKQVRNASNQQMQIQLQKTRSEETLRSREEEQEENKQEMVQMVRSIFGQSEMAAVKERELLQDKLDRFAYRQTVMNEQLIALNDKLTDTTALQAVYRTKREELELNYQNQKEALQGQLKALEDRIETKNGEIGKLDKEIESKKEENFLIEKRLKDRKFLERMKKTWLDYWMPMITAGFMAVFLGGFFGWGTYGIANEFFKGIVHLIKR